MVAPRKPVKRDKLSRRQTVHKQLTLEVLKKFRQILKSTKKYFQRIEEQCGVSGAQLWVLWELSQTPGLRVSDLAMTLSIKQPSASNLVERLERQMLITRRRGDSDRRVVRLYLTQRGEQLIARAPMPAQGVLPDALSHLPSNALRDLDANLAQLLKLMKIRDKAAAMTPLSDLLTSMTTLGP
jgi:DNA-binding MarR family transcriptional regulator